VLRALASQSVRPERVVIVDDNSSASQQAQLKRLCVMHAATYHRLPPPRRGAEALGRRSHARNAGSWQLDTELILYLDGDMLPGPKYVQEVRRYHTRLGRVYIRGLRYCIPTEVQVHGMDACLGRVRAPAPQVGSGHADYAKPSGAHAWQRARGTSYYDKWEWCAGNNLSVRRSEAFDVGLWDENFLGWGEEDIDFSYRLYRHGLVPILLASRNAACFHLDHVVNHEANISTLRANARYLLRKFPQVAEQRRDAYRLFGIDIDALLAAA